jgi:hypothetical protein
MTEHMRLAQEAAFVLLVSLIAIFAILWGLYAAIGMYLEQRAAKARRIRYERLNRDRITVMFQLPNSMRDQK